jgi:hypothetical protein
MFFIRVILILICESDILKQDVLKPGILKHDVLKPDVLWVYPQDIHAKAHVPISHLPQQLALNTKPDFCDLNHESSPLSVL